MNPYNNPHQGMHPNMYQQPQPPIQQGFIRPGMQQGGYPQQPMYAQQLPVYGQVPQQGMYQQAMPQQGMYQPRPMMNPSNIGVVNTPQGPMLVDMNTNQVLGPAPQQGMRYGAPNAVAPSAGSLPSNHRFGNPSSGPIDDVGPRSDNRYGSVKELIQPQGAPMQYQQQQPPQYQPQPQVDEAIQEAVKLPVKPKPTTYLPNVTVDAPARLVAFTEAEVHKEESSLVGQSLEELISNMYSYAHEDGQDSLVWYQSGIVAKEFYRSGVKSYENDLFQSNVSAVNKVVLNRLKMITTLEDLVYLEAYDKWLTGRINDYTKANLSEKVKVVIDSFICDYESLISHLSDNGFKTVVDGLIETMNDILYQACVDVAALRDDGEEGSSVLPDTHAVVPERVSLVYVKLLSTQIGDDGTEQGVTIASRLMQSLLKITEEDLFYLVTMDRKVYKVSNRVGGKVVVDCVSE